MNETRGRAGECIVPPSGKWWWIVCVYTECLQWITVDYTLKADERTWSLPGWIQGVKMWPQVVVMYNGWSYLIMHGAHMPWTHLLRGLWSSVFSGCKARQFKQMQMRSDTIYSTLSINALHWIWIPLLSVRTNRMRSFLNLVHCVLLTSV